MSACLLSAVLLAGCGPQEGQPTRDLERGRQLYGIHCGRCHGAVGEGAFTQGIPPIGYSTLSEADMIAHIRGHVRIEDSQMPTFSGMSQEELAAIARYVLHGLGPESSGIPAGIVRPRPGAASSARIRLSIPPRRSSTHA